MLIREIVLIILLAVSLLLLAVVFFFYKYRRAYTRERFAFRVFLLIGSLTATLIALLLSGKGTFVGTVSFFAGLFKVNISYYDPSFSDKLLSIVLVFCLIYLATRLHRDWPGEKSVREHEAALMGLKPGLLAGAVAAIAEFSGKSPLQPYSSSRSGGTEFRILLSPTETRAWHHWVARILQITLGRHLHIDELKDWYVVRRLFVSSYGPNKVPTGILCRERTPSVQDVKLDLEFIASQATMVSKLFIVIDADGERTVEHRFGIEIEYRYRTELLESLVDFSKYIEDIDFRYEDSDIAEGYSLKLPDVYVPSAGFVRESQNRLEIDNVEDFVFAWSSENTLKHLAILGEYGEGKSVLALKLTHRLIHSKRSRMPILITLGGRSPRNQTKLDILADWAATYDINPRALLVLHEAGRLLLVFDGFDEMDLIGDATIRFEHFRTLWEFSTDRRSKILITGRPNFFLDQLERERSLNVKPESIEVPYTSSIYLRPFNVSQISAALRSFDKEIKTQIVDAVESGAVPASFSDLVSRPSTLFLVANIWSELNAIEGIQSAEVIGRFIRHSNERQQRKGLRSFLSSLEREYFTVGVALAAFDETRFSNHISKSAFQNAIIKLVDRFPDELNQPNSVTDVARISLRGRLQDREMLIETISTDVRSCGIVVTDLSQTDTFKFAHKSFFEYLIALNRVYTLFLWPRSNEKVLHQAAASAIEGESRSSTTRLLNYSRLSAVDPVAFIVRSSMNREMLQFAGEILYRLLEANATMSANDLNDKLNALGIPVRRLRRICFMLRRTANPSVIAMFSLTALVVIGRFPPAILFLLASLFRVHGHGGGEFILYDDSVRAEMAAMMREARS